MKENIIYYNRRISRIQSTKRKRRRAVSLIIISSLSLFFLSITVYKIYKIYKCRDLQYAIEYELTTGTPSEKLLRVQHITLIFKDNTDAVAEASGLSKESPHSETSIKGTFKKGSFNSWKLVHSEKS